MDFTNIDWYAECEIEKPYPKSYLRHTQPNFGIAFSYAVYCAGYTLTSFYELLKDSFVCRCIDKGIPRWCASISGYELFGYLTEMENMHKSNFKLCVLPRDMNYWIGWELAYYHYKYKHTFKEIVEHLPIEIWEHLYGCLHTTSDDYAADRIEEFYNNPHKVQNIMNLIYDESCEINESTTRDDSNPKSAETNLF